jgi:hypothetical protein
MNASLRSGPLRLCFWFGVVVLMATACRASADRSGDGRPTYRRKMPTIKTIAGAGVLLLVASSVSGCSLRREQWRPGTKLYVRSAGREVYVGTVAGVQGDSVRLEYKGATVENSKFLMTQKGIYAK